MHTLRRRLGTLVVAVPLWIVMILTGGQWCLMPQGVAHPVVSIASGVGHASDAAHASHAQGREHEQQGTHDRDMASCESQAPCSVAIVAATSQLAASPAPYAAETPSLAPGHPHSLAIAPELPPPRA